MVQRYRVLLWRYKVLLRRWYFCFWHRHMEERSWKRWVGRGGQACPLWCWKSCGRRRRRRADCVVARGEMVLEGLRTEAKEGTKP